VAHSERDNIKQRQREGIAAAKTKGVRFGRPMKRVPANFTEFVKQWNDKRLDKAEILKKCRMSESTFYRRMAEIQGKKR